MAISGDGYGYSYGETYTSQAATRERRIKKIRNEHFQKLKQDNDRWDKMRNRKVKLKTNTPCGIIGTIDNYITNWNKID